MFLRSLCSLMGIFCQTIILYLLSLLGLFSFIVNNITINIIKYNNFTINII